jgi:hypothetical protein
MLHSHNYYGTDQLSLEYSIDHFKHKSNAYYKSYEEVSTDTLINDLVEKIRLLEDKLIRKDDTLNEEDDVEIFISE